MIEAFLAILMVIHAVGIAVRLAVAHRWFVRQPAPATSGDLNAVTVLQPILSGDPGLRDCLAANLAAMPEARFIWLVDEDDPVACTLCETLAVGHAGVAVMVGPPPSNGENPKIAKLARALDRVETPVLAVLDDDTVLPAGAMVSALDALERGHLVTGLPWYVPRGNPGERLVAGFVNGNAALTYPVGAALGQQRTINGMFYCTRTADLRRLGGFAAISGEITDDYAMARLYLDQGLAIVQTPIVHPIRTHVRNAGHYASILRRWMIFGMRYTRDNLSFFTLGLIGTTTVLPPILLIMSIAAGWPWPAAVLALLAARCFATAHLRRIRMGVAVHAGEIPAEILADLLTPLHIGSAMIAPHRLQWRKRRIRLDGGVIRYG